MDRSRLDLTGTGQCAAFQLRKATRAVAQLYDAHLQAAGIRSTQFTILIAVAKSSAPSVGELATLTGMDATTMTRGIRLLTADGLLSVSNRSKGRRKIVTLTIEGRRTLKRALPLWRTIQKQLVSALGETRWAATRAYLQAVEGSVVGLRGGYARRSKASPHGRDDDSRTILQKQGNRERL
jgi:DNA-binding MarR family transcriptional regulator